MYHTLQKAKYILLSLQTTVLTSSSLFLFEISTNKGDSVKSLAKFGKVHVLSFFHSHGIDVVQPIQSINTFWDVIIGMSVIP